MKTLDGRLLMSQHLETESSLMGPDNLGPSVVGCLKICK